MLASMQTECPHCHTLFRLTEAQLDMAGGRVRCGYCNAVFNALHTDEVSDNDRQLDVFEHASAAIHDDIEYRAVQKTDKREYEPEQTQTDEAGVASPDEDASTGYFADETSDVVPSQFRTGTSGGPTTWSTLLWSVAILLLIASLVTEYAWFNREQLLNQRQLQPYVAALCEHISCDGYISLHDPQSIEMLSRNVYTHPDKKNALMITATMINHAGFAQALPDVRIDFSSTRGEVVASRRFKPAEYMRSDQDALHGMDPELPVSFNLEIVDPGKDAITYEFMFL
jgi:predicted Zn finger-like uncharacterized protein